MVTTRKLQFGAAVVFANGLLALTVMAPRPALANPCAVRTGCVGACGSQATGFCNFNLPAGCTLTSLTCNAGGGCGVPHPFFVTCHYD